MKKLLSIMLGLTLVLGTVSTTFAQEGEKKEGEKKEEGKKKKGKKKKAPAEGEEKKPTR
ncbi:MAG: hypothetical protein JNL62_27915 [Bryobacterales bacterium]|nr:hypothetical protein [Bryobacterales bacterium]MBL8229643.1 hypothetical protein [Bryobacterales bacterium]